MKKGSLLLSIKGFTLVEFAISLGIMFLLMGILLGNYPETAVRLTLSNNAHVIALLLREAQVRGSAIDSGNTTLTAGAESPLGGHGVYFSINSPNAFLIFGDTVDSSIPKPNGLLVGDGLYEIGPPIDETEATTKLPNGYIISKLCVSQTGFPFTCNTDNSPTITSLTVSFTRPNPQPNIYINGSSAVNFSSACIEVRSPRAPLAGHIRSVQVFNSGMIRTEATKCDNSPL